MAARAGVEPTTLRLKAIDSTKAPPCPTFAIWVRTSFRCIEQMMVILWIKGSFEGSIGVDHWKQT